MNQEYPIRVLHRGMSYNRGGIESYLINYYRHMDRALVQFDFIVPEGMMIAFEDEIKTMGGCIYKEIVGIKKNPIKGLFYDRKFFKNHSEIQILHINDCSASNLRLMKIAKKCGVQTRILHSHNNDYLVPLRKRQLFVEKLNKKNLDKIATDLFACSDDAGRFMFGDSSFKVVKNAVEVEKYLYSSDKRALYRNEWGIPDNVNVLGCVARFDYQKNHDYLLDVFAEYKRIDEKAILILGYISFTQFQYIPVHQFHRHGSMPQSHQIRLERLFQRGTMHANHSLFAWRQRHEIQFQFRGERQSSL